MRMSDWMSDVCSYDLLAAEHRLKNFKLGYFYSELGREWLRAERAYRIETIPAFTGDAVRLPLRTVRPEPRFIALLFDECLRRLRGTQLRRMQMHGRVREIGERAGMIEIQMREHDVVNVARSEEHTSELQSLMRISYAVFCLEKK